MSSRVMSSGGMSSGMNGPVLVGWSGSAVSDRAVELAAGFAERHGIRLRVVLAWDFLDQPGPKWDPEISAEKVQSQLEAAVRPVKVRHPGVPVVCDAMLGWPPAIVCDAAADAGLLVVGRSEKTVGHFGDWSPDVMIRRVKCPIVFVA